MTNVRRPIHLQLHRPPSAASMVSSSSGPGAFGETTTTTTTSTGGGSMSTSHHHHHQASGPLPPPLPQPAGRPRTPIRPTALINFNCTQPPTIKSPSGGVTIASLGSPTCCLTANRRQRHHPNPTSMMAHNQHNHYPTKALSPSGLNDSLPSQIIPHLFVGNQEQTNRETVNKLNIKYILSLGLLPMITASGAHVAIVASTTTTTTTTSTVTGVPPGPTKEPAAANQTVKMPLRNSSADFKIKIRSGSSTTGATPTTPTAPLASPDSKSLGSPTNTNCHTLLNDHLAIGQQGSAATTTPLKKVRDENGTLKQVRSIYCKCINISDNSDQLLSKFFDEAYTFIEEARRKKCNILIHCLAGISRSPTIAIAYLMRLKSLHWKDAYDLVKQCRPQIDPNLNFMGQLRIYNRSLREGKRQQQQQLQQQQVEELLTPSGGCKRINSPIEATQDDCQSAIKSTKLASCARSSTISASNNRDIAVSPQPVTTNPTTTSFRD